MIIGRATIKKQFFSLRTPSHFEDQTNLTVSKQIPGTFRENDSRESYSTTSLEQASQKAMAVRVQTHTVLSSPNSDDETVSSSMPSGKRKSDEIGNDTDLCLCSKALPWGSCKEGLDHPLPLQQSPGNLRMPLDKVGTGLIGLSDNPPLAPVLMLTTESDTPPLAPGKTETRSKKWLLQEDGSYKPVFSERSGSHLLVSSMIPLLNEKPVGPGVAQTWGIIATLIKEQEQLDVSQLITTDNVKDALSAFTDGEEINLQSDNDDEEFDNTLDTEHDVFAEFNMNEGDDPNTDVLDLVTTEGTAALRVHIRTLLEKYRSVFATTLSPEPALIPPFELEVDKEKWEQFSNRGPPRVQSPAKQAEILKQVDELLKNGIIEPSTASYYSQVILASKPDDTWRFCIDYRKLNDCTKSASWPIPNIKEMFGRLGTHHSNTFGVMDLTAGYHQAPVSLMTRVFLAFICFCGIFQFCRLPFGPKRAPSYFQQMMASVVLIGLIYFICEMYLDDCIVHGAGEDQFCDRLEQVLARFKKHLIVLKPSNASSVCP